MMYLIFDNQGVIKDKQLNELIVQGSNNVNKIGVVLEGVDTTAYAVTGVCKLPSGETITTTPSTQVEQILDGVYGVVFSLTREITALEGTIRINIQAINVSNDKVITSYTVYLLVNEGVSPGEIVMMTNQQYQTLVALIEKDVQNDETILKFNNLPTPSDYSTYQVIFVCNADHSFAKLYQLQLNASQEKEWNEIFNFNDYYNKSETNALLAQKSKVVGTPNTLGEWQYLTIDGTTKKIAGGLSSVTAGSGLDIDYSSDTISVDYSVVASKASVDDINALIPAQASTSNQLADKAFVNSSIATNTATFRGTYNVVTDLGLTTSATHEQVADAIEIKLASLSITPTNNDYVFVSYPDATDPTQFTQFDRYKYTSSTNIWEWEYTLNNSSFTADQWAAINSGITSSIVSNLALLSENNTFTGNNVFTHDLEIGGDSSTASSKLKLVNSAGSPGFYSSYFDILTDGSLIPTQNNAKNLGTKNAKWKNLNVNVLNPNADISGYGFTLPDSTNFTADSELLDSASAQTITGEKTFSSDITVSNINMPTQLGIKRNGSYNYLFQTGALLFYGNDLGSSARPVKDGYFSGQVYAGGFNPNASGYKLTLPDTTSFTANSELVDTDSAQTLLTKTFDDSILISKSGISGNPKLEISNAGWTSQIKQTGGVQVNFTGSKLSSSGDHIPTVTQYYSLGDSTHEWINGYFSGQVYAQNTFNVINASDIVNNTLTQAQYDLITNGKPTLIKGTLGNRINPFIQPCFRDDGTYIRCYSLSVSEYSQLLLNGIYINKSTKVMTFLANTFLMNDTGRIDISGFGYVNGKLFPSYPSSPATPQYLTYGTNNTLSWTGISTGGMYQHAITFTHANYPNESFQIILHTSDSTAYTSFDDITNLTERAVGSTLRRVIGSSLYDVGQIQSLLKIFDNYRLVGWYISSGTITQVTTGQITFVSDSVIPL